MVTDSPRAGAISPAGTALLLAPLVAGAVALWLVGASTSFLLVNAVLLWGGALLVFAAGRLHRGAAKLTGAAAGATLFLAGFLATAATVWAFPLAASVLLAAGILGVGLLDLSAGRRGVGELLYAQPAGAGLLVALLAVASLGLFIWQSPFL